MDIEIWEQKQSGNQFVVVVKHGCVVAWGWAHDYKYDGSQPTETSLLDNFATRQAFTMIKLSAVTPLGARG